MGWSAQRGQDQGKCRVRALGGDPEGLGGSLRGSALILKAPASQKQVQNAGRWESSSDAS